MEVVEKRAIDDLHKVNQVVQHKIIIRQIQRQAQERMEKEEECLLRLKEKKKLKKKKRRPIASNP